MQRLTNFTFRMNSRTGVYSFLRYQSSWIPKQLMNSDQRNAQVYRDYYRRHTRNKRIGSYIRRTALGIVTFAMVMIIWQPWNPYSKAVSFNLRKALWAESDKEDDYLKALDYYQRALDEAGKEKMEQLDPRYTGIVLKIAEMYEKMGMVDREREVYEKLAEFLFGKLINDDVKDEWKDILIDRDLVVTTRLATLADKPRLKETMDNLLDRLIYCERRIDDKWPFLSNLGANEQVTIEEILDLDERIPRKQFIEKHSSSSPDSKRFLGRWYPKWPYFKENLIRSRDLYAMKEMADKRNDFSIELLKSNLIWMGLSQDYPIYIGTAICNLASAYYMKSERHQLHIGQINRMIKAEEDPNELVNLKMVLKNEQREQEKSITESEKIYKKLIDKMGGVEGARAYEDNAKLQACLCMALYSLGVIELSKDKNGQSKQYFTQAKNIAADAGLIQIVERVDKEMEMEMETTQ
ncbi:hypothetical protein FOA43_001994 [Brettanomyces nanus]|uniref:Tetratricopeptide repeat protein n=1 Tax=Eeniella nana TaxID=13502 RepID=A0A875S3M2_EENNA|nr:uncharacterized protein FOA43_001994 [Brettanomyces nanus]QPG74662.1 hypothetical protein FOA43_001994 [Brettanomyces nanus]